MFLDSENEENILLFTSVILDTTLEPGSSWQNVTSCQHEHGRKKNSGALSTSEEDWTEVDTFPTNDVFCSESGITNTVNLDENGSVRVFSYFTDTDLLKLLNIKQTCMHHRRFLHRVIWSMTHLP